MPGPSSGRASALHGEGDARGPGDTAARCVAARRCCRCGSARRRSATRGSSSESIAFKVWPCAASEATHSAMHSAQLSTWVSGRRRSGPFTIRVLPARTPTPSTQGRSLPQMKPGRTTVRSPAVRLGVSPAQALLPGLRDGVAVAAIEAALERRILRELARGRAPVVDAERADQHEARRSGPDHRSQQRLGRQHGLLELLHDVAREGGREVDDGVHSGEQGVEVRAAQVAPAGLDPARVGDGSEPATGRINARTQWPCSTSAAAVARPRKPPAPVSRTFTIPRARRSGRPRAD